MDWAYLDSANFSGSAWGWPRKGRARLSYSKFLEVKSFELGVFLPPSLYRPPTFVVGLMSRSRAVVPKDWDTRYYFLPLPALRGRNGDANLVAGVSLPIPYRLRPVRYAKGGAPWHLDVR